MKFIFLLFSICHAFNGFYGIVGPNVPIPKINTLYQLFTGNGIIQGAFIENNTITPVQHIIQTEKLKYSDTTSIYKLPFYLCLHFLQLFPNPLGVANTAFFSIPPNQYILFERDVPYKINIDKKQIHTLGRIPIRRVNHISGHTKLKNEIVHSLEYSIVKKTVSLLFLTTKFELMHKTNIKTKYIPLVHDFLILKNSTLFADSPIYFSFRALLQNFPILVNKTAPTYIHVVNRLDQTIYTFNSSFFIFHYAYGLETNETIEIYAPVYYDLNFSTIHIHGIYSKLLLDKQTKQIRIDSTLKLEQYNLDFPVKWKEYIILRNIQDHKINGFVICKGLNVTRCISMPYGMAVCGEPSIVNDTLVCIGYDLLYSSYLIKYHLLNETFEIYPLNFNATLGFHSIFIPL
jgi:carotenoid cleavage dioxygenase-like enzyme